MSAPIDADDVSDEGYAASTSTSYATSIASSIKNGKYEYGRTYASYGKHVYGLPIDEQEQDRNDLQHYKFFLLRDGQHYISKIGENPQAILDLGTGSGIWAIDMADAFPSAKVVGVDIAPVQPTWVPPNCEFEILDVEQEWNHKLASYDFIHARELHLSIRDWSALFKQCYDHLRPGGWLELGTTVPLLASDDDTLPKDGSHQYLADMFFEIANAMGADGHAPEKWKQLMIETGFEDVYEERWKIPRNPWPKEKRLKDVGALELVSFQEFAPPVFRRGGIEVLKRDPDVIEAELAKALEYAKDRHVHSYIPLWVLCLNR